MFVTPKFEPSLGYQIYIFKFKTQDVPALYGLSAWYLVDGITLIPGVILQDLATSNHSQIYPYLKMNHLFQGIKVFDEFNLNDDSTWSSPDLYTQWLSFQFSLYTYPMSESNVLMGLAYEIIYYVLVTMGFGTLISAGSYKISDSRFEILYKEAHVPSFDLETPESTYSEEMYPIQEDTGIEYIDTLGVYIPKFHNVSTKLNDLVANTSPLESGWSFMEYQGEKRGFRDTNGVYHESHPMHMMVSNLLPGFGREIPGKGVDINTAIKFVKSISRQIGDYRFSRQYKSTMVYYDHINYTVVEFSTYTKSNPITYVYNTWEEAMDHSARRLFWILPTQRAIVGIASALLMGVLARQLVPLLAKGFKFFRLYLDQASNVWTVEMLDKLEKFRRYTTIGQIKNINLYKQITLTNLVAQARATKYDYNI